GPLARLPSVPFDVAGRLVSHLVGQLTLPDAAFDSVRAKAMTEAVGRFLFVDAREVGVDAEQLPKGQLVPRRADAVAEYMGVDAMRALRRSLAPARPRVGRPAVRLSSWLTTRFRCHSWCRSRATDTTSRGTWASASTCVCCIRDTAGGG